MRVVLADDSGIFRDGLRLLLEAAGVQVVAAVGDVQTLHDSVRQLAPDVAVVDVRMPPSFTDEGTRAAVALRTDHPGLGILVLSTSVDPVSAVALLEAVPRGIGYLLKDRVDHIGALLESLQQVADGGVALDPQVVRALLLGRSARTPLTRLTERELEVLALLAEGRSNVGIARQLRVSPKTVETHVAAVFRALGLETDTAENRRVHAALAYLRSAPTQR